MKTKEEFLSLVGENAVKETCEFLCNVSSKEIEGFRIWECEFDLKMGKMANENTNTWFKTDTEPGDYPKKIIAYLADDTFEPDKECIDAFEKYRVLVKEALAKEPYATRLKDVIRNKFLLGYPAALFPMTKVEIRDFEVFNLPPIDFVLSIKKLDKKGDVPGQQISKYLLEEYLKGRELNEVVAEKKAAKHPDFVNVQEIKRIKYEYEVTLTLYVDYAPAPEQKVN